MTQEEVEKMGMTLKEFLEFLEEVREEELAKSYGEDVES